MAGWKPIDTVPRYKIVMLYRLTDLFPVVGFVMPGKQANGSPCFVLEEGGPEDGEHRNYPFLQYAPTHWKDVEDDLPEARLQETRDE